MRRLTVAVLTAVALLCGPAFAQQVDTNQTAGTIAVTNTFQSVFPRDDTRHGCSIQNTGTAFQYVFFGPIASATKAASFQLAPPTTTAPGGQILCAISAGGAPIKAQVSITGTANDTFVQSIQ